MMLRHMDRSSRREGKEEMRVGDRRKKGRKGERKGGREEGGKERRKG